MSRTRHHGNKAKQKHYGDDWMTWGWLQNYPKWHDHMYHTKPRRAKERESLHHVQRDPDNGENEIFPLDHKPHKYYW